MFVIYWSITELEIYGVREKSGAAALSYASADVTTWYVVRHRGFHKQLIKVNMGKIYDLEAFHWRLDRSSTPGPFKFSKSLTNWLSCSTVSREVKEWD